MKKKLTQLAEEYNVEFEEALSIVKEKIPAECITGKGKNTWLSEEAQAVVREGLFIEEIIPKNYKGEVLSECPNKKFNFVYSKEVGKRVPVLVPRRLRGKLINKVIMFEAIEDGRGTSYRYIKR